MSKERRERRHRSRENAGSVRQINLLKVVFGVSIGGLGHWNIGGAKRVARPATPRSTKRNLMLGWAIAFLVVALIAGALGSGVLAGTAFAAAKVLFVLALLAFFISAVVEVTRRGAP